VPHVRNCISTAAPVRDVQCWTVWDHHWLTSATGGLHRHLFCPTVQFNSPSRTFSPPNITEESISCLIVPHPRATCTYFLSHESRSLYRLNGMPSSAFSLLAAATACVSAVALAADSGYDAASNPCAGRPTLTCYFLPTTSLTLENTTSSVTGQATFTPEEAEACRDKNATCVTRVAGVVSMLGDATPHGWHIHQFGNISVPNGMGTGGHINPAGVNHALPDKNGGGVRHVGDLGNLFPSKAGVATFNYTLDLDTSAVVGRGVIVHAAEDDGGQPTGNAGARLAQCVLGYATV
jgi:Cu/Zn superoxide dismutase